MMYQFQEAADKIPLSAPPPLESTNEEDHHQYLTLSYDHLEGDGILIIPRSILLMRVDKSELHHQTWGSSRRPDRPASWWVVSKGDGFSKGY